MTSGKRLKSAENLVNPPRVRIAVKVEVAIGAVSVAEAGAPAVVGVRPGLGGVTPGVHLVHTAGESIIGEY